MTIIVEDGSGVAGANSYVSEAQALAYASARGVTLVQPAAKVLQAMAYIEAHRDQFQGTPTNGRAQPLQWPRTGVAIDGHTIAPDEIPRELETAQLEMVLCVAAGVDPMALRDGRAVKRKKVDVLETEYFSPTDAADGGVGQGVPAVDAALAPLLRAAGAWLRAVRV